MASIDDYHYYGSKWWTNEDCPYAYQYANISEIYPEKYFYSSAHPDKAIAEELYAYMQETYINKFQKAFHNVFEVGGGSGELTKLMLDQGIFVTVLEGTEEGYKKLVRKGIPEDNIIFKDIRTIEYFFTYPKYDLVVCTEVAEHIEPWFASKVVELCVGTSDVVWWSSANSDRPSHYHHPNEAPIWAWDNIFNFFGYGYAELNGKHDRADRLYYIND